MAPMEPSPVALQVWTLLPAVMTTAGVEANGDAHADGLAHQECFREPTEYHQLAIPHG